MPELLSEGRVFRPRRTGGFPFKQFPAADDMTPELAINEQARISRQQIYNKYNLQWKEMNRSAQFIGRTKAARMRQGIHAKFKQEMLRFNQQVQQQITQLRNIDRLAQQRMIANPDEIKAHIVYGSDVARSMYPKPERERTIPQQFTELDIYSQRISDELERFKEEKPSKALRGLGYVSPLAGAISIYRGKPKRKVRIWNPTTGKYEKATSEEIAEYDFWLQQEKNVAERKREIAGQFGVSQRIVQPGTKGGTFSDKIAESVRPRQRQTAQPTAIELRRQGTREAYEKGKRLGYWR
jgi:hypothetical protein